MLNFDPTGLPKYSVLDDAHEQGFRAFLHSIGHDEKVSTHRDRASRTLLRLQQDLNTNAVPDYSDPYAVAAYLVKYHLSHCSLAYWSYKGLFSQIDTLPSYLYVCDVGAGTYAGYVGLILALSELSESPVVYFDAFDTSEEMLTAGLYFLNFFIKFFPDVNRWNYRQFTNIPDCLPDLPKDTLRVVTAFHLSLPYDNGGFGIRYDVGPDSAQRSLQSVIQLVSPDAKIFTCHEGKVDSLRQVLGDSSSRFKSFDIPSDNGVPGNNSPFYTDCAPYLGFDVPDGQPWPVRTWSRYRFSLPKRVLLWNVWSIAERELEARQRKEDETLRAQRAEAERQRQLENQRLARQKAEEERQRREQERKLTEQRAEEERHRRETLDRLWTTLRECKESREVISAEVIGFNFAGLSVKWEGLSGFVRSVHCQDLN